MPSGEDIAMNRTDLQQLAEVRIEEARVLLSQNMPDGAYYLAGYAVECGLKACIAKLVNQYDFPDKQSVLDSYTHDFDLLVRTAGLVAERDAEQASNIGFRENWQVIKSWSERSRYVRYSSTKAQELYDAITDHVNGVLPWIKVRW
jgi:hypothetical protein